MVEVGMVCCIRGYHVYKDTSSASTEKWFAKERYTMLPRFLSPFCDLTVAIKVGDNQQDQVTRSLGISIVESTW